jgi:rubredoxin
MGEYDEHNCNGCSYTYRPREGDQTRSISPGTPFDGLPDDWTCPECGAGKLGFIKGLGDKKGRVEDDLRKVEARNIGWKSSINR